MSVLDADVAVKAAMGAGLAAPSVGQTAQGGAQGDSDGKKRVNKGGVPGMEEDEEGYRYMPEETWGPGKVLKLFPSQEERQSSHKVPNFGFVEDKPALTPEQFVQQMEQKPKIRMSKYKVNTRTGEPIEDTEVEFDRMRFGKTFDLNPDVSDEIDEDISEDTSNEMQEKSLGSTLKQRMPGASIAGRAAARFGVIMDELGKMRCPPGTPAANQFTDMTGSNCFGVTPGNIISEAVNLAQRLIPQDDPKRGGLAKRIANFMFDMENGIFGNNVWYHADGTRMKHGEWRKFREAGGVAKNERWMVNGVERVFAELDSQDARMEDLYAKLGVDVSDDKKANNEDVYEAFEKLRDSGTIPTRILGRPTPAQVEAMMVARLKNMDAHWISRTDDEKRILLNIEVQRYRELERAHLEAFLDEVIKNPEHMKSIVELRMKPGGDDRASYAIYDIQDGVPVGGIDIDIPNGLAFQDSMLPNLSPEERLRIWAEGGQSDAVRAMAVKDFLVNSNSHAGQMIAMVDGGRGLGRHDMKHEIAHSIQAAAIFEHMKSELDARGSLIIPGKKTKNGRAKDTVITSVDELTSKHLMDLMIFEDHMGIDLETLSNLRSRGDVVAFLAGRYIWDVVEPEHGAHRRAAEIGAELWALRSSGLIYGDDVDAALEYMDNIVSGKITADRTTPDDILTERIYNDHLDGARRVREAREARERAASDEDFFDADGRASEARMSAAREAYAKEKRAQVKAVKEAAKTMNEEQMVEFLVASTELSDALSDILDAAEEAGEEADWMKVMDRDALDAQSKAVSDEWVKRFTVRRSPEALEKLQKMIDDKRESKGTLSPEKVEERRYREFMEGAAERAKAMDLAELVQNYSDWEEIGSKEGIDGSERARMKQVRDMYRDEYIKRRTEGPGSISKEDARKEFNSKFKELRKPKTAAARERESRAKPKKFTSHNGKNGARTFATEERARLLEGATTEEKIAFVEMGSGETDVITMMGGYPEGMAAARAIQRRNTRLKKNGILPDGRNQHEASIEEQVENFYIPLLELMEKSSLSQTVEMYVDSDEDVDAYVADLLSGNAPRFTNGINAGTLVTNSTDLSDGKKIVFRFPEGSKALFPDWSYSSDSDNGEQKIIFPPSKMHLVEIRDDGTIVLEVGEQMGAEAALKDAVKEIGPWDGGSDYAYREGLQRKVSKAVDKRIEERRRQGMFDPASKSPVEEERFSATADNASAAAGFAPDAPSRPTTPPPTEAPARKLRGVDRKRSTAAIDRAKSSSAAQQELDAINAFITGEGAYQGRTNFIGTKVASIMESNFGTRNISELTEEQKYDLIDLISEAMSKAPKDQQRGLSQARSRIQDHVDISRMIDSNDYSDPYAGGSGSSLDYLTADTRFRPILGGEDKDRLSSGAKWGQMPSSNEQISRLLEPSNNDGFNEIYGAPQTRAERIEKMVEMQSEVMSSLREMIDNIPGSGDELGLDVSNIDPVIMDLIKNSSDEEIYEMISKAAMDLHNSFDARPRVRMREDELEKFIDTQRYGRERTVDNAARFSSGRIGKGIRARAKERAVEMIAERIGKDEDSREIAEMVINTVSSLKYGPEAALTRLAIDLGRRGSRDIAEKTVQELRERGKITDEQAQSILSKLDKFAPDGLPEPLKRGIVTAARATADAVDTPENRERLAKAREAAGDVAERARDAVGEGARNVAERGRERLRRLRERDDRGELPSSPEDVPFGDFDPADAPVDRFSSGRRLDRRVSNSEVGREKIMDGAKKTRTRLSSGETPKPKQPREPFKPRDPDNGPMTGKFIDIFRGVKSYREMLDRYNEQEVIFFDYETTGLDSKNDRPVQIGAVKMKGGKVVERFNIFSNPEKELSVWSKKNLKDADGNPLTDEWLSGQPSIAEAHQQLLDFFGPDALLGGQYTPFDLGFLEESLKSAGIEWKPAGVIDSKALADELLPKWTPETGDGPFAFNDDGSKYATNSLKPLAIYLGVELDAWHSADADSAASAMIVQKILERAAERDDVPKHLLNVDSIPDLVTERRAKHKIAMDKYEANMKKYKADMDAYNAAQSGEASGGERLSSGETPAAEKVSLGRKESGIPDEAKKILQKDIDEKRAEIDELKELNRRLRLAMEELQATGSWQGEKYDIRINDQGKLPPATATREEIEAQAVKNGITLDEEVAKYVKEAEAAGSARRREIERFEKNLEKLEKKRDVVLKDRGEKTFHIEELLSDPAIAEELRTRREEVLALSYTDRDKRWADPTDPSAYYVLHWGATEFVDGELDPRRSRGTDDGPLAGNTRAINVYTAKPYVSETAKMRKEQEEGKKLLANISFGSDINVGPKGRNENFNSEARNTLESYGFNGFISDDGQIRWDKWNEVLGDRAEEAYKANIARIQKNIDDREPRITRREKISEQLVADGYQYSSAYNARMLQQAFAGYGGRYADEGADIGASASWGDGAKGSELTGIHIFRVTPENATSLGGGEDHLIGKHKPIASLVAENNYFPESNPAVNTWEGWVDMAIQADIAKRSKSTEASSSGERLSSGGKAPRSSKEILDEAAGLGIEWQGKSIGTSEEDIVRKVGSSIKTLRKSKELGLTDVPELSDDIKKIVSDYAAGNISLKGMRQAILYTNPRDEQVARWARGNEQLPIGWRVAVSREIALEQNDLELVKKIDDFIAFMGDIDNVSDEKLEELIKKASDDFGKNMGSPIIQTPDVKRIIRGAGGVTVHDSDERKLDNLSGTTGMGESLTISARRRAETMYGLPFTGENTPEDRAITAMRPISGHSLPKDAHVAREKKMKKIYGEDFTTMYDFPIGADVADLSQTEKYGRSHIILSDAVNERTKVVNGDAVSRFGSDGAAVTDLESVGEAGIAYADPIGMLYSSMTGDSGGSIAGPLDPSFQYSGKYNETATLGTFDPGEVKAIYVADIGQLRRGVGDTPSGINPDYYGNLSLIFDFAITRDEILDSRGTEIVAQIGEPRGTNGQMGVLEYLHPENVELFNSSMTSAWLDRYENIFGEIPREILIPEDEPETTPYEAYLRAKINERSKNGVGKLKETAATFGETRDGKEFDVNVIQEELDRAINARKNRASGGERLSSGGGKNKVDTIDRFSSGATYRELVRTEGRPSEKQREAISDVRNLLRDDEFGVVDTWTYEDGVVDSPERAELKAKIAQRITEAFSHDIEAREDVVVTAKNGEKINLGKDFEVVITEVSVEVDNYGEETLVQIEQEEMYDKFPGLSNNTPVTLVAMKIAIKPKDKEAAKRLEDAGIPELYMPDYVDGKPGAKDVQVGYSSRQIVINGDEMHANHENLFIRDAAQGKGIGSLFNAKNEGVYEEMGIQRIFTQGQSSELGESVGGTHWPRNGFTWAGEKSKQDFIKAIDNALRKRKSKFSEEERERISSLYRKNPSTGKFETDASAEELIDFEYADQLFQEKDEEFMFKRDIELVSVGGARLSSGASGRSPGLKANRDRSVSEYGMDWKPEYSEKEWVSRAKTWDGWENIPTTEVDLSSEIRPTESHLKGSSIDKVVSGEEAFREGYYPNVVIDTDGKMYVSDGHNRVAMNRALGNEKMTARVVDLREQDAPWGNKTPDTAETRLSSGEGPRSKKPTRVKKYKGYDLKEPDNPGPKDGEYPDDVVEAAKAQRDKVAKVEAEITKLLIDLAEKNKANMEGLDYRMKALKSLVRKIAAEKDEEHGGDAKKAAEAMSDIARYTMSYEPEDYIAGVKDVVEQMQALGYELNVKNYWKGGDPYQGINVAVVHPDGTRFELQFHTPQSVADKEKIHAIYEDYRTETDPRKRFIMYNRMVRMAEKIGVPYPPEELLEIGNVREQPFTPR
jgi:DNA polymerase III epsilon subunit-like protein